jgi:reticulon-3
MPLPPLPNLEVLNAVVEKATDYALVWINRLLVVGHDIAIKTDRKVIFFPNYICSYLFLFSIVQKMILILWLVSFV